MPSHDELKVYSCSSFFFPFSFQPATYRIPSCLAVVRLGPGSSSEMTLSGFRIASSGRVCIVTLSAFGYTIQPQLAMAFQAATDYYESCSSYYIYCVRSDLLPTLLLFRNAKALPRISSVPAYPFPGALSSWPMRSFMTSTSTPLQRLLLSPSLRCF